MNDIKARLDQIPDRIGKPDFLTNSGLGSGVGIYIFPYPPKNEMIVRHKIHTLKNTITDAFRIIEFDLYLLFMQILEDNRVLDAIPKIEQSKGASYLLTQLQGIATPEAFIKRMQGTPRQPKDVIFMTGVGRVYPFIRSHRILNKMQVDICNVPVVLFYPGEFNGQDLILFNVINEGNYYRAFTLL